ncbi:uncharacterized protein RAG0_16626 [Rhynchosporium agropyri]|uniref:Uncharacterized protein n=1 Tax=Rhynchosporium agropyri TaxID=914238 RepID=A0A1E1LT18_9HELO|nr:uncharacterized protein RAG0_16626 [Rhynchosporium agropyri]
MVNEFDEKYPQLQIHLVYESLDPATTVHSTAKLPRTALSSVSSFTSTRAMRSCVASNYNSPTQTFFMNKKDFLSQLFNQDLLPGIAASLPSCSENPVKDEWKNRCSGPWTEKTLKAAENTDQAASIQPRSLLPERLQSREIEQSPGFKRASRSTCKRA